MAFTPIAYNLMSDLVVDEFQPTVGWARKVIPVQTTAAEELPLGAVVYRAKGVDPTTPYDIVADNSAIDAGNEFAVILGDKLKAQTDGVTTEAGTTVQLLAYVRGPVMLKQKPLLSYLVGTAGLTESEAGQVLHLLESQGVLSETTIGYDPTA